MSTTVEDLPDEIIIEILNKLDLISISKFSQANQFYSNLIDAKKFLKDEFEYPSYLIELFLENNEKILKFDKNKDIFTIKFQIKNDHLELSFLENNTYIQRPSKLPLSNNTIPKIFILKSIIDKQKLCIYNQLIIISKNDFYLYFLYFFNDNTPIVWGKKIKMNDDITHFGINTEDESDLYFIFSKNQLFILNHHMDLDDSIPDRFDKYLLSTEINKNLYFYQDLDNKNYYIILFRYKGIYYIILYIYNNQFGDQFSYPSRYGEMIKDVEIFSHYVEKNEIKIMKMIESKKFDSEFQYQCREVTRNIREDAIREK